MSPDPGGLMPKIANVTIAHIGTILLNPSMSTLLILCSAGASEVVKR